MNDIRRGIASFAVASLLLSTIQAAAPAVAAANAATTAPEPASSGEVVLDAVTLPATLVKGTELDPGSVVRPSTAPYQAADAGEDVPTSANETLVRMGAELEESGSDEPDLSRYFTGEKLQRKSVPGPVAADITGRTGMAPLKKLTAAKAEKAALDKDVPQPQSGPKEEEASLAVGIIIAVVVAVAAAGVGIWTWLRGKNKNKKWEESKSNQDVIALEKARRDNDAETLGRIKDEARSRQARMQERVDHAESAGNKTIPQKDGGAISVKDAKGFVTFDGLAAARAAMNENAVSTDPRARVGGDLPATWQERLGKLEAQSIEAKFEGPLALQLKAMKSELSRQNEAAALYKKDIGAFAEQVPGLWGGRLKEMVQRGEADLAEFKSRELAPETAMFQKVNGAMRGRVSDRLAGGDAEYQAHLARMQSLGLAAEGTLKSAVEMARNVDKDMKDMASHERSRVHYLLLASQNERVEVDVYDDKGNRIGTRIEDHSAQWKALAAAEGAEARASAASAKAGVQALNTIIPLLHKDSTLQAENLTFVLPKKPTQPVRPGGSVFFDFWMPASWNFFMTIFSGDQADMARAKFAPVKGALESVLSEVESRRRSERDWTDERIDGVLDSQMKRAGA